MRKVKLLVLFLILALLPTPLVACASTNRCSKSLGSEITGGLERRVEVYSYDGKLIKSYEGKIDISSDSDTEVLFDLNGKRYIITNAIVITEEK